MIQASTAAANPCMEANLVGAAMQDCLEKEKAKSPGEGKRNKMMDDHSGMKGDNMGDHHDGPSGMKGAKEVKDHHASSEDLAAGEAAALGAAAQMAAEAARVEAIAAAAEWEATGRAAEVVKCRAAFCPSGSGTCTCAFLNEQEYVDGCSTQHTHEPFAQGRDLSCMPW